MTYNSIFVELMTKYLSPMGYKRKGILFYKFEPEKKLLKYATFEFLWGKRTFRIFVDALSMIDSCLLVGKRFHAAADDDAFNINQYLYLNHTFEEKVEVFNHHIMDDPYCFDDFREKMQDNIEKYVTILHRIDNIKNLHELYSFRKQIDPDMLSLKHAIYLGYNEEAKSIIETMIQQSYKIIEGEKQRRIKYPTEVGHSLLGFYEERLQEELELQKTISSGNLEEEIGKIDKDINSNIMIYANFFQ